MWNGSSTSAEGSRPGRVRPPSVGRKWRVAVCLALLGGCHHAPIRQEPNLRFELSTISGDDLFLLGVSHATSGDLLRAEQYLIAARHGGRDATEVAYWLVRVCVAGSRYHSALTHALGYLRDHPADWGLRLVVASIHEALGDLSSAQLELERIVKLEPTQPLPHYRLAMLFRGREADHVRAHDHLETYLKLNPGGAHAPEVESALAEVADGAAGPRRVPYPDLSEQESRREP